MNNVFGHPNKIDKKLHKYVAVFACKTWLIYVGYVIELDY